MKFHLLFLTTSNICHTGGDESDDEEEDSDDMREERLEFALKKLGNMLRKPLNNQ